MFYINPFYSINSFCRLALLLPVAFGLGLVPVGSACASPAAASAHVTSATGSVGDMQTVTAGSDDTFVALARKYSIGYVEMVAANPGVDPWLPGAGTRIVVPSRHILPDAPHTGLVINLGEMRLYYYASDSAEPETYPIGMGRDGYATPMGATTVVRKVEGPSWYRTASERADKPELPAIVPPGPDNPLGAYALYLGWPGYLIHGTDDQRSVGREASRGCIRMYDASIQRLYDTVAVGTKVTVVDQPVGVARIDGELYLSVFPSRAQAMDLEDHNSFVTEAPDNLTKTVLAAAGPDSSRVDWETVRRAANERKGYPIRITQ